MSIKDHPNYNPAMKPKEAAEYIGVHYKTIMRMAKDGELPCCKSPGGRVKFRLKDLNEYLSSRVQGVSE